MACTRSATATVLLGAALAICSCELLNEFTSGEESETESTPEPLPDRQAQPEPKADVGSSRRQPVRPEDLPEALKPLARAPNKMTPVGRPSTNMGYRLSALAEQYALAGAIEVPSWSAPSEGNPRFVRDDDLSTTWICEPNPEQRCAIGIHLPEDSRVKTVRLFAHAPPGIKATKYRRIKEVRIHTDQGFTQTLIPEERTHVYVVFSQPVETTQLTVEVLRLHPGPGKQVRLAELEVYGLSGAPREGWDIDPSHIYIENDTTPWKRTSGRYNHQDSFVQVFDSDKGTPTAFAQATAMYGKRGDRMLLLERVSATDCNTAKTLFFLVDQTTRVIAPLGELGGAGGDVYRLAGTGFGVGYAGKYETTLSGVTTERETYKRIESPRTGSHPASEILPKWKADPDPLPRGGHDIADKALRSIDCKTPGDDHMVELSEALKAKNIEEKPGEWRLCKLNSGAVAYLTDRGPCGNKREIHVLDPQNVVVASRVTKGAGSYLRIQRLHDKTLLIESGDNSDGTQVLRAHASGIDLLAKSGSFAVRPPGRCRETCTSRFPNRYEPNYD